MLTIQTLPQTELNRIGEIDRSEEIRQIYVCICRRTWPNSLCAM